MKRLWLVLFALVTATVAGYAVTVDEITAKHIEARGGEAKLRAIKTYRTSGAMEVEMNGNSMQLDMLLLFKRDNKVRVEQQIQGAKIIVAYDGKQAWTINPMQGPDPTIMPKEAEGTIKSQGNLDGYLFDWKKRGFEVTYEGVQDVDDMPAHKLKVVLEDKKTIVYSYIDATSFMEVMNEMPMEMQGQKMVMFARFSDFTDVAGVKVAMKTVLTGEASPKISFSFTKTDVNIDIPDSEFEFPGKPTTAKKGMLAPEPSKSKSSKSKMK